MNGLKLNQPLKDDLFVFNKAKYPGVERNYQLIFGGGCLPPTVGGKF